MSGLPLHLDSVSRLEDKDNAKFRANWPNGKFGAVVVSKEDCYNVRFVEYDYNKITQIIIDNPGFRIPNEKFFSSEIIGCGFIGYWLYYRNEIHDTDVIALNYFDYQLDRYKKEQSDYFGIGYSDSERHFICRYGLLIENNNIDSCLEVFRCFGQSCTRVLMNIYHNFEMMMKTKRRDFLMGFLKSHIELLNGAGIELSIESYNSFSHFVDVLYAEREREKIKFDDDLLLSFIKANPKQSQQAKTPSAEEVLSIKATKEQTFKVLNLTINAGEVNLSGITPKENRKQEISEEQMKTAVKKCIDEGHFSQNVHWAVVYSVWKYYGYNNTREAFMAVVREWDFSDWCTKINKDAFRPLQEENKNYNLPPNEWESKGGIYRKHCELAERLVGYLFPKKTE